MYVCMYVCIVNKNEETFNVDHKITISVGIIFSVYCILFYDHRPLSVQSE
jgi:hypothetical protein